MEFRILRFATGQQRQEEKEIGKPRHGLARFYVLSGIDILLGLRSFFVLKTVFMLSHCDFSSDGLAPDSQGFICTCHGACVSHPLMSR